MKLIFSYLALSCFLQVSCFAQRQCHSPTPTPCPALNHDPCNATLILPAILGYEEQFSGGSDLDENESYYCPIFEYPSCPVNLKQSNAIDMSDEDSGDGNGGGYIVGGAGAGKMCFEDVPCRLNAEISTSLYVSYPCIIAESGHGSLMSAPPGIASFIKYVDTFDAWCVPASSPPQTQVEPVHHTGWDILLEDTECENIWLGGGPGEEGPSGP